MSEIRIELCRAEVGFMLAGATAVHRVIDPPPGESYTFPSKGEGSGGWYFHHYFEFERWHFCDPPFKPGDDLVVCEAVWYDIREPNECVIYDQNPMKYKYRTRGIVENSEAGTTHEYLNKHRFWRHMPAQCTPIWSSRIRRKILDVTPRRVREITNVEAIDYGIMNLSFPRVQGPWTENGVPPIGPSPVQHLWMMWPGAYEQNPWMWIVELEAQPKEK